MKFSNIRFRNLTWFLSVACLIHCISLPLITLLLPFFEVNTSLNEYVSNGFVALIAGFSGLLIYRHKHLWQDNKVWIILLVLGLVGLSLGHYITHGDHSLTTTLWIELPATLCLVIGQYKILRATQHCSHTH